MLAAAACSALAGCVTNGASQSAAQKIVATCQSQFPNRKSAQFACQQEALRSRAEFASYPNRQAVDDYLSTMVVIWRRHERGEINLTAAETLAERARVVYVSSASAGN